MAKVFFFLVFVACISGSFAKCKEPGVNSPATCVSKTQFVLNIQNPVTDTPQSCPPGLVCADVADICILDANRADCPNTVPGTDALCNACEPNEAGAVCVNQTAFTFCDQGKLVTSPVITCSAPTPYCKIVSGVSFCTAEAKNLDCPASGNGGGSGTGGGGGTGTGTNTCTAPGFFPDTTDLTCSKYYKCQQNAQGTLEKFEYTCTTTGYVFNASTKKCVAKSTYTCPNK